MLKSLAFLLTLMLIIGMTSGTLAAVATARFSDVTDEYHCNSLAKAGVVVGYERDSMVKVQ